jgi:hypothetical protein
MRFLWCFSTSNATVEAETDVDVEKQSLPNDGQDTAPTTTTSFLSKFSPFSSTPEAEADINNQQKESKPRGKPPKYNRQNLPSVVIEDPPPWVTNYRKLKRQSDGTLFVTPLPQEQPKPDAPLDATAE